MKAFALFGLSSKATLVGLTSFIVNAEGNWFLVNRIWLPVNLHHFLIYEVETKMTFPNVVKNKQIIEKVFSTWHLLQRIKEVNPQLF